MTLSELLPALHGLPRSDKLRVIQLLASDVAREEGTRLQLPRACTRSGRPTMPSRALRRYLRVLDEEQAA